MLIKSEGLMRNRLGKHIQLTIEVQRHLLQLQDGTRGATWGREDDVLVAFWCSLNRTQALRSLVFGKAWPLLGEVEGVSSVMPCYKGTSLGTNFTLASPFTILAHFGELDWRAQYGAEERLVGISVGMKDTEALLRAFETALKAAEAVA